MERIFRRSISSTVDKKRSIEFAVMITTGYFGTFSTTTVRTNDHIAECWACPFTVVGTAGSTPLPFGTFSLGKMSLMAHRLYLSLCHNYSSSISTSMSIFGVFTSPRAGLTSPERYSAILSVT